MAEKNSFLVWPNPQEWTPGTGHLMLSGPLSLVIQGDVPWLPAATRQAAEVLNRAAKGTEPAVVEGEGGGVTWRVTTMEKLPPGLKPVLEDEGYVLDVTRSGVLLAGRDARGVFWGAQTLAQLMEGRDCLSLPVVTIRDWPRYPIRPQSIVTAVVAPRKENTMTERNLPKSQRRQSLPTMSGTVTGAFGSILTGADHLPRNTNPRAIFGDFMEPDWDQQVTITVGPREADLVGASDRVIQAAVDYVARRGGGTVRVLPGTYRLRNSIFLQSRIALSESALSIVEEKKALPSTLTAKPNQSW